MTRILFFKIITNTLRNKTIVKYENYTFNSIAPKFVAFSVDFESLSYMQISEMPKTSFTRLVAYLGGTLGKIFFNFVVINALARLKFSQISDY